MQVKKKSLANYEYSFLLCREKRVGCNKIKMGVKARKSPKKYVKIKT